MITKTLFSDSFRDTTISYVSATLLILRLFPCLGKDVVCDGVPGIVNADKQEQQRRSANDEQGWARMGVSHVCRSGQHCVRRKWEQNMKQPVLEYGPVDGLHSHTPRHDDGVYYPTETN
jgi:hypothetical protein